MISKIEMISYSDSYFSLSTRDGHIAGNILVAQSSSLKQSDVAASANNAAFLA